MLILVFLGLSVLDLSPMYVTNVRQTDVRQKHHLMPPPIRGGGIIMEKIEDTQNTEEQENQFLSETITPLCTAVASLSRPNENTGCSTPQMATKDLLAAQSHGTSRV